MTHDNRSPAEIERDIEYDRNRLNGNFEALQDRFSVDGAIGEISEQLRRHGGEIGQSISRTVRDNPAAVALTGIGIAWMIFGNRSKNGSQDRDPYDRPARRPNRAATYPATISRPDPRMKGGTVGTPDWAQHDDESLSDRLSHSAASARDGLGDAARHAGSRTRQARDDVATGAANAKAAASAHAQDAGSAVSERAQALRDRAERLRKRLSEGTEEFSEDARARVIAAREAALDARDRAAAAWSERSEQASDIYERQPLVVGALALAVGAAIGGALPRTRTEDDWVGDYSDDLMHRAEEIFEQERRKVLAVVKEAQDEAQTIGKEARKDLDSGAPDDQTAAEAIAATAKASGKRIADAATKKADAENLGKISS